MRTSLRMRVLLAACAIALLAAPASAGTRIGGGVHYLQTVGDMKDNSGIDKNSFGFLGSIHFAGPLLSLEADLEVIPDYIGSGETMWQPQAYVFLGHFIYGGVGAGIGNLSKFGWQNPFFALRAGVDFMLGSLDLDVFASYRFQTNDTNELVDELGDLNKDSLNSITFGALIRFGSK